MSPLTLRVLKQRVPPKVRLALHRLVHGKKVRRFIPARLGIDGFFEELNKRDLRYVVIRWAERLPYVRPGGDVDLLVHDEDATAVIELLEVGDGVKPCNLYSVSGTVPGTTFHRIPGLPYFPPEAAGGLLDRAVVVKGLYSAPCLEDYFLSLAFHSLYHKGLNSGVPTSCPGLISKEEPANDYPGDLARMAKELGIEVEIGMESLAAYLAERGWNPTHEMLSRLVQCNPWVRAQLERQADQGRRANLYGLLPA